MKEMIKNASILLVITLVAGCLLGLVNYATKDTIELRQTEQKNKAYQDVFSDASTFEATEFTISDKLLNDMAEAGYGGASIDEVIVAEDASGNALGNVYTVTSHEGYGGDIRFTVGIREDGTVNGISLLEINETAGLGMNAEKVLVPQFAAKKVDNFAYTKTGAVSENEVDAISGATITTRAITNGVNMSLYYFQHGNGGEN